MSTTPDFHPRKALTLSLYLRFLNSDLTSPSTGGRRREEVIRSKRSERGKAGRALEERTRKKESVILSILTDFQKAFLETADLGSNLEHKKHLFTRNSSEFLILRLHATLGKWGRWEEGGRGKRGEGRDREEEEGRRGRIHSFQRYYRGTQGACG